MSSGRTIAAAADFLTWAHYFFGRSSRYTQISLLHFAAASANLFNWAHYFFGGAANERGSAHCQYCRFARMGPLFL